MNISSSLEETECLLLYIGSFCSIENFRMLNCSPMSKLIILSNVTFNRNDIFPWILSSYSRKKMVYVSLYFIFTSIIIIRILMGMQDVCTARKQWIDLFSSVMVYRCLLHRVVLFKGCCFATDRTRHSLFFLLQFIRHLKIQNGQIER